jgi:non-ribosomal peptide synthase protein (TIGR01720 family)
VQELLLAASAHAYGAWTGASEVTLDLEGHGRAETLIGLDVARTVGWFMCLYPVRLPTRAASLTAGLAAVKRRLRAVPGQGIGYGLLRYVARTPELAEGGASICFNYLGQWDTVLEPNAPFMFAEESTGQSSNPENHRTHVLEISAFINDGRLQIFCAFSKNLHRRSSIERFAEAMIAALRALLDETLAAPATAATTTADPPDFAGSRVGRRNLEVLRRQLTTNRTH